LKASGSLKTLDAFLSYNSKDRELAGSIKERLEFFGVSVFLAHSDIEGGDRWERAIIDKIRSCDVVLALLTPNFRKSKWTDHETGMGIGASKHILPLSIGGVKPYGFIARYQALPLKPEKMADSCREIILAMKRKSKLKEKVQNSFIESFVKSWSFDQANEKSELLEELGPYNGKHVNKILRGYMRNSQIRGAFTAGPKVKDFLRRNRKFIRAMEGGRVTRLTASELERLLATAED
jgi:hypothetical protein